MDNLLAKLPNKQAIEAAHQRIEPYIHRTPVLTNQSLNNLSNASLYFKCENLQKVGAFKMRGAANAVFSLPKEELINGVATHSSGNHAQALALAAKLANTKAYIVMPETAPKVKVAAVRGYGAEIIFCKPTLQAREDALAEVVQRTGATFIHPYNDYRIITGQATTAKELFEEVEEKLDILLTPVGGGGLLAGSALSTLYFSPGTKVIAGEPAGADDAFRSFMAGKLILQTEPNTIADGLLTSLGDKTYPIIKEYVDQIITVREDEIRNAMRLIWERMKIVIEPSSAVPFAAVLKEKELFADKKIGIILSGGNVDLEKLPF